MVEALRVGYRHIDTAAGYDNEGGVGLAPGVKILPMISAALTVPRAYSTCE